jgi:hypothetical protein
LDWKNNWIGERWTKQVKWVCSNIKLEEINWKKTKNRKIQENNLLNTFYTKGWIRIRKDLLKASNRKYLWCYIQKKEMKKNISALINENRETNCNWLKKINNRRGSERIQWRWVELTMKNKYILCFWRNELMDNDFMVFNSQF